MKFELVPSFFDICALVIQFTGLLCSLPFIALAFMAGLRNKGCSQSCVFAAHVFSALTALWLVVLGTGLVIVKVNGWISMLPFIPYASFVCYFVLAVVAYAIKNVLIAKVAGGTFGLSVLLLIALSTYLSVLLCIRIVQYLNSPEANQRFIQAQEFIDRANEDPANAQTPVMVE